MKNLLARGGIEFLAVLFGISGSLWVDDYRVGLINKEKSISTLNSLKDELIDDKEYFLNRHSMITDNNKILNLLKIGPFVRGKRKVIVGVWGHSPTRV